MVLPELVAAVIDGANPVQPLQTWLMSKGRPATPRSLALGTLHHALITDEWVKYEQAVRELEPQALPYLLVITIKDDVESFQLELSHGSKASTIGIVFHTSEMDAAVEWIRDRIASSSTINRCIADAEALQHSYEQLLTKYDLEKMLTDRYRAFAIERGEALKLAQAEVRDLQALNNLLIDALSRAHATAATGQPELQAKSDKWLGKVGWMVVGGVVTLATSLGVGLALDVFDKDDERSATALERSADADETSAETLTDIAEAMKTPIQHGQKCYISAFGQAPPDWIAEQ